MNFLVRSSQHFACEANISIIPLTNKKRLREARQFAQTQVIDEGSLESQKTVSLILEPTHLRRGDKNGKDYYMDTKLEPVHTGFKKERWNQSMETTGKTGLSV